MGRVTSCSTSSGDSPAVTFTPRDSTVEDIVITLGQRYQLLRCMGGPQGLMLYLNMQRRIASLPEARLRLNQLEAELVI